MTNTMEKQNEPEQSSSSSSDSDEVAPRHIWAKQIEFTLSCIGYTIGLGNIWRFPYLCMINGGGAFLIPYITFMFLCGFPLYFLELALGQFTGLSCVSVWRMCPLFKGAGWCACIVTAYLAIYYNIILVWIFYYLGLSFSSDVPWRSCLNPWNTARCMEINRNNMDVVNSTDASFYALNTTEVYSNITEAFNGNRTPTEEFWMFKVLDITSGINELGRVKWDLLICLFVAVLVGFLCLIRGIKSSGKIVYVSATVPYLFLTILFIRGITLPGSLDGIKFFVTPDWSQLATFRVWQTACVQVFYTLGVGWGCILSMASYNRFRNNCLSDAAIVCVTCSSTSVFAGFVIFSVIGFMAHQTGQSVQDVITSGPGLAFVAYPEAVAQLPVSPLWAVCFFLMLLFLGLDSQFTQIEAVNSILMDEFPKLFKNRRLVLHGLISVALFLLAVPMVTQGGMYLFQILDWYSAIFGAIVVTLLELIAVCYLYGIGRFYRDLSMMFDGKLSIFWAITWGGICPLILTAVLILTALQMSPPKYGDYEYPDWAITIGWIISVTCLIPIPLVAIYLYITANGTPSQRMKSLLRPTRDWGPSVNCKLREEYQMMHVYRSWWERMRLPTGEERPDYKSNGTTTEKVGLNSI